MVGKFGVVTSILLVALIAAPFALMAQNDEPEKIDEFSTVNSEEIQARLDFAMDELNKNPNSLLQFVFSRGEKDSFGSPYRLYGLMKTYLLYRKVETNKIVASFCKPQAQKNGQIWLVNVSGPRQKCDQEDIVVSTTTLFDNAPSPADNEIGSCCVVDLFGPAAAMESIRAFADLLSRYPESKAFIYAYGGTNVYWTMDSKGRERAVRNLDTAKDIVNLSRKTRRTLIQNGIQASRIVTRNAGYRDAVAQIEMWIVPRGGKIPKPSPDYPKKRRHK